MSDTPNGKSLPSMVAPPAGRQVYLFNARGGVARLDDDSEQTAPPPRGFVLVSGNFRDPEFAVWLRKEIGEFAGDLMSTPNTRARCTVLDDKVIVVLRVVRRNAEPDDVGRQLLSLFLEKGRVIVASELNIPEFLGITQWQHTNHAPVSPADLVARLALRAADRIEPLLERLGDALDDVEEALLSDHIANVRDKLGRLRRTLIAFRRLVWPQRDALNTLEIEDLAFLTARDRARLREASSRTARLGDELQALSERAVLVHEQILDTRAEQLNHALLFLAAVTAIFMPLTLITGLLGMNVEGIPWSHEPWAFAGVLGGLIALGVVTLLWLRHKKWI